MSNVNVLPAATREGVGKGAARAVRREGLVPAVVYGAGEPPLAVSVKQNELLKALKRGKFLASLLDLELDDGKKIRVLPKEVQRDVVLDLPVHVDFLRLSEKTLITLFVPLDFVNQDKSPGVKRGGSLEIANHEVRIRCRAGAIPERIEIDLEGSKIEQSFMADDLPLPSGVQLAETAKGQHLAKISAPKGIGAGGDDDDEGGATEGEEG